MRSNIRPLWERISIPGGPEFSQQRLTSLDHYESAWRTATTGFGNSMLRGALEQHPDSEFQRGRGGAAARLPGCFLHFSDVVPADENSGDSAWRGDANHKRI